MRNWIFSKIGAKLLTAFSLLLILSMFSLNYVATKLVVRFGAFSAARNEANIKDHTHTFLSRITYEQTMRYDGAMEKIAAHSSLIAKRANFYLANIASYGKTPRELKENRTLQPNGMYCNKATDLAMVCYWGSYDLSPEIVRQLNALSHLDHSLQDVKESNPTSTAAYIVAETGFSRYYPNIDASKLPPAAEYDMREAKCYLIATPKNNPTRKTVWSDIVQNETDKSLMTTASTPIYTEDGRFFGIAAIDVSLKNIVADFTVKESPKTMVSMFPFLLDQHGRVIACSPQCLTLLDLPTDLDAIYKYSLLDSPNLKIKSLARSIFEKDLLISRFSLNGDSYLVSSRVIPATRWRVGVVVPESAILDAVQDTHEALKSTVDSITAKFALVTLTFLMCSIIIAVVLSVKYLITPLKYLADAASRVKEGDLNIKVAIAGEDDIGILARSFNSMVEELRKSKDLEKQYARTLEDQVRIRTRKLKKKNDELGKTLHVLQKEIHERTQIEEALRMSEWKYRQLYENSRDGFVALDINGVFVECNEAYEKMLGYSIEELRQMDYRQVTPARWHELEERIVKEQVMVRGYSGVYEKEYLRKDSIAFPVELSVHLSCDVNGHPIGMWAFARDITERKQRIEELKIAKEEAEAATRAKSQFLANMSHEIRTPMNAILGFSDLLYEQIQDEQQKQYLASLASSGKALLSLINDILDLSKIEAGKMEIECNPVNPRTIVEEIRKIFSCEVQKKGLKFDVEIAPLLPEFLLLDEIRLRQILLNLVGNAVKFTSEGYVKLSAFGEMQGAGRLNLIFSVEDTGIGIAHGQKQLIFEAFQQQEGQSAAKYGGTGLGLSITKRLVEMMGGEISVESEQGKGSTFEVSIKGVAVSPLPQQKEEDTNGDFKRTMMATESEPLAEESKIISPEILARLPDLVYVLRNEMHGEWTRIREAFIINEIEKFARQIADMGEKYRLDLLTGWGRDLLRQALNFDMENLPKTLASFPSIIENIEKLIRA